MFIVDFVDAVFRNLSVTVEIDAAVLPHPECEDKVTTPRKIPINFLLRRVYFLERSAHHSLSPEVKESVMSRAASIYFPSPITLNISFTVVSICVPLPLISAS